MEIYNYQVKDAKGNLVSMSDYKGKVLLIVNTATGCGFTPQYKGLQYLYENIKTKVLKCSIFHVISLPDKRLERKRRYRISAN